MTTIKETSFALILVVLSISVFFLLGEIVIRINKHLNPPAVKLKDAFEKNADVNKRKDVLRQMEKSVFMPDEKMVYKLKPGIKLGYYKGIVFNTNSMGLRYKEIKRQKDKSTYRILFLGDSVVFGEGLEENQRFTHLLEKELNMNVVGGKNIEVVNCGVPGFSNSQELTFLKSYLLGLKPDMVIIGFCLNDFQDILHNVDESGILVLHDWEIKNEAKPVLELNWLRTANYLVFGNRVSKNSLLSLWLYNRLNLAINTLDVLLNHKYPWDLREDFYMAWRDSSYGSIEGNCREFKSLSVSHGFRLLLVTFPFQNQLKEKYREVNLDYVLKPQKKLKEICDKLSIPFFSLYESFHTYIERNRKDDLYIAGDDVHPGVKGSNVIASILSDYLLEHNKNIMIRK